MELEIVHTSRIRSQFPTAVLFSVWLAFVFFLFSFFFSFSASLFLSFSSVLVLFQTEMFYNVSCGCWSAAIVVTNLHFAADVVQRNRERSAPGIYVY